MTRQLRCDVGCCRYDGGGRPDIRLCRTGFIRVSIDRHATATQHVIATLAHPSAVGTPPPQAPTLRPLRTAVACDRRRRTPVRPSVSSPCKKRSMAGCSGGAVIQSSARR